MIDVILMEPVDCRSSPDAKIALFRSLFRGRDDVYRRDRRKDQLLQENGYIVLRFLAEDVAKDLDAVLDAILRVFANRRQVITLNPPGTM